MYRHLSFLFTNYYNNIQIVDILFTNYYINIQIVNILCISNNSCSPINLIWYYLNRYYINMISFTSFRGETIDYDVGK